MKFSKRTFQFLPRDFCEVRPEKNVCGCANVPAKNRRHKTFFRKNLPKTIRDLFKNFYVPLGILRFASSVPQRFASSVSLNVTEMV